MLAAKNIKRLGLRFGRALLTVVRTAVTFSAEYPALARPMQQAFELLNTLLKEGGSFTFGFVDNQVMLNNILTTDPSLGKLETEFLKRGIAAVTFEPGLTFARFRRTVVLLSVPIKVLEECGGLMRYLEQNGTDGVRILQASRNQKKDNSGDTIIDTDSETYIVSRQMTDEQQPRDLLDSIDALLQSAAFEPAARSVMLSGYQTQENGAGDGLPMAGPGVATGGFAGRGGSGSATGAGRTGGWGSDVNGGATAVAAAPALAWAAASERARAGRPLSFMEIATAAVERSLVEETASPRKSYVALAKVIRDLRVDAILSYFPPEQHAQIRTMPAEEVAAEYIQQSAIQWAGKRLAMADSTGGGKIEVEEDVVRVLARSLQATQMADRMAEKLAKFVQDFAVPEHVRERIRDELRWTSLTSTQKYDSLMKIARYSALEFRRLMEHVKELSVERDFVRATALSVHYFDFLAEEKISIQPEELSRAADLMRSLPLARVDIAPKAIERLHHTLLRPDLSDFVHFQASNALAVLSQSIAAFEDFDHILEIGVLLQNSRDADPEKHAKCCAGALGRLLPVTAMQRILEIYLAQRSDPAWIKKAATILRFMPAQGAEQVLNQLVQESDAKNRLALLRLIKQLGPPAIKVARAFLNDTRWYVVRNVCSVLLDLNDPELATDLAPALVHADRRVQQAAVAALIKSRAAGRAPAFAQALPSLAPRVLDDVLHELMFLKDPQTIPDVEKFVLAPDVKAVVAKQAMQVLALIPGPSAEEALARILRRAGVDLSLRRLALATLAKAKSPLLAAAVREVGWTQDDPLAPEAKATLAELEARPA